MKSQSIFITGASAGIGEALSLFYARRGVTLGLVSLNTSNGLGIVADKCRSKGAIVHTYVADVCDTKLLGDIALDFQARSGSVDLVIANAGVAVPETVELSGIAIAERNMNTNYFGVINTVLPFVEAMKEKNAGHLVVISSISSLRATHNSGSYSASKAAVNLWTEGLRLRLRPHRIPVSTLCVGFVDTAMTRSNKFWMPGLISAERAAVLIARAIDRRKRLVTLPWKSGLLWSIFHAMPGCMYDWVIDHAKSRGAGPDAGKAS